MIVLSPLGQRSAGRRGQPDDPVWVAPAGVEVIVMVEAVYNGLDHRNLNGGRPIPAGERIVLGGAYAQSLVDAGLVRYPTTEDAGLPPQTVDAIATAGAAPFEAMTKASPEPPIPDEPDWLDWTPIMDAGIPEGVAKGLYERGYTSKRKMVEAYALHGDDAFLVVVGMGPGRVQKIKAWAGIE